MTRRLQSNDSPTRGAARTTACCAVVLALLSAIPAAAQKPDANAGRALPAVAAGPQGVNVVGAGDPNAGPNAGGAANADFDSLIDLITSTVEADSWMENGTGEGDIQPFPNGVYVDASGALCVANAVETGSLSALRDRGLPPGRKRQSAQRSAVDSNQLAGRARAADSAAWRAPSALRYVSLPRLEAAIARRQAAHLPLTPDMLTLAGLKQITHILVYPETHDLVLAGPAGDWLASPGGRILSADAQRPVVRLDDLLALMRRQRTERSTSFGCSIVPRQEALARAQDYLNASASEPIEPSGRAAWLAGLRASVGVQDVEYYDLDPNSRVARLLLEADYHMKLIGMGLAKGVPGVHSYLSTVRLGPGGQIPPMTVLRWWFSMPKSTVAASAERDAFAMPSQCVEVLSENEMLAARGERIHTGESDALNRKFADSFTANFEALADRYPVYGELARLFELALALAVVEQEGLAERVGWSSSLFLDSERLRLPAAPAPRAVETVINHRVIGGRHIVAGVSGGVWISPRNSATVAPTTGQESSVLASLRSHQPANSANAAAEAAWWWD